jgi:hypothetical protein
MWEVATADSTTSDDRMVVGSKCMQLKLGSQAWYSLHSQSTILPWPQIREQKDLQKICNESGLPWMWALHQRNHASLSWMITSKGIQIIIWISISNMHDALQSSPVPFTLLGTNCADKITNHKHGIKNHTFFTILHSLKHLIWMEQKFTAFLYWVWTTV